MDLLSVHPGSCVQPDLQHLRLLIYDRSYHIDDEYDSQPENFFIFRVEYDDTERSKVTRDERRSYAMLSPADETKRGVYGVGQSGFLVTFL